MGICLCGEEDAEHRRFRQVPFPNGGRDSTRMTAAFPPQFHHPHFQQLSIQEQEDYLRQQQQYYELQQQQQSRDPRSPSTFGGTNGGPSKLSSTMTGEGTRFTGQHHSSPNGGVTVTSHHQLRRDPSQTPGPRPDQGYSGGGGEGGGVSGPVFFDPSKAVVYRAGNEKQTAILKTPRGNTGRAGTGRAPGGGNSTPRTGGSGGGRTPSNNNRYRNDPYDHQEPHHHTLQNEEDGDGDGCEDEEMILICADCYADVMDESCPKQCSVSGKMHV